MNKSTTIINNFNQTDRMSEIIILGCKYIVFTLYHSNIIVLEITDRDKPILLINRNYNIYNVLLNGFNEIINYAINANDNDEFINNMDTYINLDSIIGNDTIDEIMSIYKIIMEDYNL